MNKIDYLRLSVTDRCNLNCFYCRPKERLIQLPPQEILSFEEIVRFLNLATHWGIKQVRVTGGEPLLRRNIVSLVRMLSSVGGIEEVTMTTNGLRLTEFALPLKKAGLSRINVSLDSLDGRKFLEITGSDGLKDVLRGITAARRAGLNPIKVNVVLLKGVNEEEIFRFVNFALENYLLLRFIEHMPINGKGGRWYISSTEIRERIQKKWGPLERVDSSLGSGPAQYFRIKRNELILGFISPLSQPFCDSCRRLRLTADGKLRSCLLAGFEVDLKGALREGASEEEIKRLYEKVIQNKPKHHHFDFACSGKFMFEIGG
jgi:cyclic pyranopterin phosphate synthase